MKTMYAFGALLMISSATNGIAQTLSSKGSEGDKGGNGGAGEVAFHAVTAELQEWITRSNKDGTLALKLRLESVHLTASAFVQLFNQSVKQSKVKFYLESQLSGEAEKGDAVAQKLLSESTRACWNLGTLTEGDARIGCVEERYQALNDSRYPIALHEYLGVAQLETNDQTHYSRYPVSKYVVRYVKSRKVLQYYLGATDVTPSVSAVKLKDGIYYAPIPEDQSLSSNWYYGCSIGVSVITETDVLMVFNGPSCRAKGQSFRLEFKDGEAVYRTCHIFAKNEKEFVLTWDDNNSIVSYLYFKPSTIKE